ncbi:Zinc finger C2H2-type [Trinorchestia longiramus]|nr:Zinc finger C2H2-type [Trinorchestia longiramus]
MDGLVTSREQNTEVQEPISMSDSLLSRILKLPDEGNSEDCNASSDFSNDLHNVEDWFKSKNDSMSGLDFDSDLKNSELDIGDLFNLKGMLHINQLGSSECTAGNSQVKIEPNMGSSNSSRAECSGQNHYEKYLTLPSGALKATSFALDKGIFEEMLLADSVQRLYKNKSIPYESGDASKNSTDSEETLLPAFQELLANNSSMERKEIMRLTQNSNLPSLSLDFEVHSPLTSTDQLNNLVNGSFLKSKLNKDVPHLYYADGEDSNNKEQCSIKNLLASSALSELCIDDLRCHELSVSEEMTNLPSEFFSTSSSNSIETDSRLSSILALNAHESEGDGASPSCKDILDTIDKNFLKSDLGINPNPDLRPSKWSYETTLSDGSLLVCNSIDNENEHEQAAALSISEKSAQCNKAKEKLVKDILNSASTNLNSVNIVGDEATEVSSRSKNSFVFGDAESNADITEKSSPQYSNSDDMVPAEDTKTSIYCASSKENEVFVESDINSKSTQISHSESTNDFSYNSNPILKLIQDQRNNSPISQALSPLLPNHLRELQSPSCRSVPMIQPSLVFSAVKSHDKKINLPENLLLALQESYKSDTPSKLSAPSSSASQYPLQRKVVRITKTSSPKNIGHTLPKVCLNKAKVFGDASSIKTSSKNVNGLASQKGLAKVVMSVDPKANLTSVLITSSNKELTVFKINSSDLVKAVSCIKQSHLDPLGLIPSQLIQRAQTASTFIKEIQLENGLLSADQLKAGKLSPSQNFEINQMLPELKPPLSKNKNSDSSVSKSSFYPEKPQIPCCAIKAATISESLVFSSADGSRSVFPRINVGTVGTTAAPGSVSGPEAPCPATRAAIGTAPGSAPSSEAAVLQLSSVTKIIKNTAILSNSAKCSKAYIYSPDNKPLLVPNVRASLKPGAYPTMVSVPSVLDSLPAVSAFSPASSLLPAPPADTLPSKNLKNPCQYPATGCLPSPSTSSPLLSPHSTSRDAPHSTLRCSPRNRCIKNSSAVENSVPSSSSVLCYRPQKRKAEETELTNSFKMKAVKQRIASKRIQDRQKILVRKSLRGKSSASETESTGGGDASHEEDGEDDDGDHEPKASISSSQLPESESLDSVLSRALESVGSSVEDVLAAQQPSSPHQWACIHPGCSTVCSKLSLLKVHLLNHFPDRPYRCSHEGCDWSFASSFKLKRHMETHLNRRDFVCDEPGCERRFSTIYNLRSHRRRHELPCQWQCHSHGCDLSFRTKRHYQAHLRTHEGVQAPYKCTEEGCTKSYFNASSLTLHLRNHSRDPSELQCQWPGCHREFDKPCRLKAHMRNHTGQRPFVCDFEGCKWSFKSSSKLTRHKRKHTNCRKFSCPICHKSFLRSEHLKGHLLLHTGVRNFSCTQAGCNAKFTAKSSLYVHLKKHAKKLASTSASGDGKSGTGLPALYCPRQSCLKHFSSKSALREHTVTCSSSPIDGDAQHLDYITLAGDRSNLSPGDVMQLSLIRTSTSPSFSSPSTTSASFQFEDSDCSSASYLNSDRNNRSSTKSKKMVASGSALVAMDEVDHETISIINSGSYHHPSASLAAHSSVSSHSSAISSQITIPSQITAIPSQITAIPSQITAIPPQITAIPSQITAIPSQITAIPSQITAIPSQITAIPSQITAIPSQITAIPSQITAIPSQITAISSQITAIPSQITGMPSQLSSISSGDSVFLHPLITSTGSSITEDSSPASLLQGLELLAPTFSAGVNMSTLGSSSELSDDACHRLSPSLLRAGDALSMGSTDLYPPDALIGPHLLTDTSTPLHSHQTTINLRDLD